MLSLQLVIMTEETPVHACEVSVQAHLIVQRNPLLHNELVIYAIGRRTVNSTPDQNLFPHRRIYFFHMHFAHTLNIIKSTAHQYGAHTQ